MHRSTLWKVLELYGIPDCYISIFKSLYENSSCCVKTESGLTDFFEILSRVQQGCVLSPFFFFIILDFILKTSLDKDNHGLLWSEKKLSDIDFADDLALLATTCSEMQIMTNNVVEIAETFGLRVNIGKTKVQKICSTEIESLKIKDEIIDEVESFSYLGSIQRFDGDSEIDTRSRLGKGAGVFKKLHKIWNTRKVSMDTKLRLFNAVVISTATYAADTWKSTAKSFRQLDTFQQKCLRKILGVKWQDRITNEEILRRTNSTRLSNIIKSRRVQLLGHIIRMPKEIPANVALNWRPDGGKRSRGRPKKSLRATLMQDLRDCGTN